MSTTAFVLLLIWAVALLSILQAIFLWRPIYRQTKEYRKKMEFEQAISEYRRFTQYPPAPGSWM